MAQRVDLDAILRVVLGSNNVYFQPPPGHMMSYPCIVYNRSNIRAANADNLPYKHVNEYTVTVIDANPDSEIPMRVASLPRCQFDRSFTTSNLNHYVLVILF